MFVDEPIKERNLRRRGRSGRRVMNQAWCSYEASRTLKSVSSGQGTRRWMKSDYCPRIGLNYMKNSSAKEQPPSMVETYVALQCCAPKMTE